MKCKYDQAVVNNRRIYNHPTSIVLKLHPSVGEIFTTLVGGERKQTRLIDSTLDEGVKKEKK
jgi:hypothetical protein